MPLLTYLNLGLGELAHTKLTVELADRTVKYPKGIAKNVLVGIGKFTFPVDFIILDMPEDIKVPLILRRPFLSTARAKLDVYKRNITLRRMELDLEDRLKGESLVLNRSLDPFLEDYIKLNDLNEPFELRRNQGDNLMSTIEEGEVIEEFRTRDDELDIGIDDYFNKMVYKGNNVIRALMNVPIFVGTFFVVTDFAVLENMDAYRDEGMGDVIFGEPFLREVGIKTKQYEGIITIYNGDDEVTYQMVRSHSRFKHHTNEQCNKIPPLLKVPSAERVKIIPTNIRLETTMPQKEETFQVVIEIIKNSTCFKAFTIYADVPEIFMQQFWYTIKKLPYNDFYEFLLANKKCTVNAIVFRIILDICPRVEGVDFTDVPDDDIALTFLIDLGYKGSLNRHTNMFMDHMHQPWRTLAAIINKCLSGKTTSNEKL
ncbi:putative reverse transcriptase domain-containing protein [Tanacetum coccineum]